MTSAIHFSPTEISARVVVQSNPFVERHSAALTAAVDLAFERLQRLGITPGPDLDIFFSASIGWLQREVCGIAVLDREFRLRKYPIVAVGTVDEVQAYMREIASCCLSDGATFAIHTHNHPNGCANPSQADLDFCGAARRALLGVGVFLLDSQIVTRAEVVSLRERRLPKGTWGPVKKGEDKSADAADAFDAQTRVRVSVPLTEAEEAIYAEARRTLAEPARRYAPLLGTWALSSFRGWLQEQEQFYLAALALDDCGQLLQMQVLARYGPPDNGICATVSRFALQSFASRIVIGVFNETLELTRDVGVHVAALLKTMDLFGIEIIDILLVSKYRARSLRERGALSRPPILDDTD